jgi:class I fructose-bisphosphate aldolase
MMVLPIDQGLEHGPVDFFAHDECGDPNYQFRLAIEGGFSGIALHLGLAEKYGPKYAGKIPVVLKLNGKTRIPDASKPLSPMTGSVEDAVRIGADAVGYTLYVGSPRQVEDFTQFRKLKEDAERYGMPIVVWAYPRGEDIDKKGGRDCLYAVDYAARVADELGADVVKLNIPEVNSKTKNQQPAPYDELDLSLKERVQKVVKSAGKTLVIFSGGSKTAEDDLMKRAKACIDAGATGFIFGRNIWQREWNEALRITKKLQSLMA